MKISHLPAFSMGARHVGLFLTIFAAVAVGPVAAQENKAFPDKTVKLVVTYSPGGAFDTIGRLLAQGLQGIWGQSVIVENRPGASGTIGADVVARATPDGSVLLIGSASPIVVVPFLGGKLPYDPLADLKPIGVTASIPNVLVVNAKSRYKTFKDFIADAKARPGAIDYASSGRGDSHHMTMEHMMQATGVKLNEIPYKGGAPAVVAVSAGEVQAAWLAVSTALPLINSGQLTPLAVSASERVSHLPDVPTVAEQGYPGFEVVYWIGVMGPAKLSPAVVRKIETDLQAVVRSPSYRESISRGGSIPNFANAEQFSKIIQADYARNKKALAP